MLASDKLVEIAGRGVASGAAHVGLRDIRSRQRRNHRRIASATHKDFINTA
jgi:hypothetical protein